MRFRMRSLSASVDIRTRVQIHTSAKGKHTKFLYIKYLFLLTHIKPL